MFFNAKSTYNFDFFTQKIKHWEKNCLFNYHLKTILYSALKWWLFVRSTYCIAFCNLIKHSLSLNLNVLFVCWSCLRATYQTNSISRVFAECFFINNTLKNWYVREENSIKMHLILFKPSQTNNVVLRITVYATVWLTVLQLNILFLGRHLHLTGIVIRIPGNLL